MNRKDPALLKWLKEHYTFCNETGQFVRRLNMKRFKKGTHVIGTRTGRGYMVIRVGVNNRQAPYARMIFLFMHGHLPVIVDHIDRNPLNNRIENLRAASHRINARNRGSVEQGHSEYLGVTWCAGKWVAAAAGCGHYGYLGRFINERDAARAYDYALVVNKIEGGNPNFPELLPRMYRL